MIIINLHTIALAIILCYSIALATYFFEALAQEKRDQIKRKAEQARQIENARLYEKRRAEQKIGWRKGERPSESGARPAGRNDRAQV